MSEKDVFTILPGGRLTWAVGAVHGESGRLQALHAALLGRIAAGDSIIYLGNLMGYGPNVYETMQEILLFRRALLARPGADCADFAYLRGSQEEMWHRLLQIQFAVNPKEVLSWMFDHGVEATVCAYGSTAKEGLAAAAQGAVSLTEWTSRLRKVMRAADGHNALLSALRRAAFTEDNALLFVHAGIDVSRPLSEQYDSFWWGATPFDEIAEPFCGFGRVVRGYERNHRGIEIGSYTASIDGGCGFGGSLCAVCFDAGGELIDSVEA